MVDFFSAVALLLFRLASGKNYTTWKVFAFIIYFAVDAYFIWSVVSFNEIMKKRKKAELAGASTIEGGSS